MGGGAQRSRWPIVIVGVLTLLLSTGARAQERPDFRALILETQKKSDVVGELAFVWWLPEQFWRAAWSSGPNPVAEARMDQLLAIVRRYTIVGVVNGRMGPMGGATFMSEDEVRSTVTIKDAAGTSYVPLAEASIDPDLKNLLQILKPMFTNIAGPIGQNINFLVFPSKSDGGRPVADATSHGALYVLVGEREFKYDLPLVSLLPPKIDPDTGQKFPGNYRFNPYTGRELGTASPTKPSGSR